jgi:predicted secreted protein with PEFG-CTERM motif
LKIRPIFALLAFMMIGVLMASILIPAYASLESCSSDNGSICVNWYFIDKNGAQVDRPSPVLIDTTHTHETTIKWYVVNETGSGAFQFKTMSHVSKGTPGMIKNCTPFPVEAFNGSAQIKGQYECTINADGDMSLGTLEIDLAVNNGHSLPFYDTSNHFVGTSFQYSTDVVVGPNVVPEFGQISALVLIISTVAIILISTKSKLSMMRG